MPMSVSPHGPPSLPMGGGGDGSGDTSADEVGTGSALEGGQLV